MPSPARPWFAPKRYGYGAGLPISWEGWAALVGFLAASGASLALLDGWVRWVVFTVVMVAFVLVAYAKTEGGWRWRGGR